jgi:tRNA-Thr(GGU) m(6)t(6)A37 methyltransferase TsaA
MIKTGSEGQERMRKADSSKVLELRPIGHVENRVKPGEQVPWEDIDSQIVIDHEWSEALEGLEEFSHIIVIFWLDRPKDEDKEMPLKIHPEAKEDMPVVGLFATRTPYRPNPIGLTTVELLAREDNTLRVRGLDAYDGTPVLDIKPYLTCGDMKLKASVAEWCHELWGENDSKK